MKILRYLYAANTSVENGVKLLWCMPPSMLCGTLATLRTTDLSFMTLTAVTNVAGNVFTPILMLICCGSAVPLPSAILMVNQLLTMLGPVLCGRYVTKRWNFVCDNETCDFLAKLILLIQLFFSYSQIINEQNLVHTIEDLFDALLLVSISLILSIFISILISKIFVAESKQKYIKVCSINRSVVIGIPIVKVMYKSNSSITLPLLAQQVLQDIITTLMT